MNKSPQKHIVIDNRIRRSSTGRYCDRLVEHLQNIDKYNKYTILIAQDDDWQPRARNFGVQKSNYKQFSLNPLEQLGFAWQLYKLRADLVHFPMNQQPVLYLKTVVTSTLDLTMLEFTRAGKTPLPIFWLKMAGYRFLFWYSNKKSRHIITISNYVKKALEKLYPFTKGKASLTYNAAEPKLAAAAKKPKFAPKQFIFYVGTAFPHKNLKVLVEAHQKLLTKNPNLELVLVGKTEFYYKELSDYITDYGFKKVHLTGFVPDNELKWYYEHAKAYVFPSLSEGFGLPGLEAMVHGCPVISSNATCLPEVYGDAAHYFDPNNTDDISEKVSEVLGSKELRDKLVKQGYKQVKKYSWEKMAKETLAVYKKVLSN